jgi:hypothetical protein
VNYRWEIDSAKPTLRERVEMEFLLECDLAKPTLRERARAIDLARRVMAIDRPARIWWGFGKSFGDRAH